MIIYDKWDETIDENFARLIYDTQIMLQSYNSTILWNQNTCIQFRNHCEAVTQYYLWSVYIYSNVTNEWDKQTSKDRWYMMKWYTTNNMQQNNEDFRWNMTNNEIW